MTKRPHTDRLFGYTGRATRREFGVVTVAALACWALSIGLFELVWGKWIGDAPFSDDFVESILARILILVNLVTLGSLLATAARRLHDTGRGATWLLLGLLPMIVARDWVIAIRGDWPMAIVAVAVGGSALAILVALPGIKGRNAYGADPRTADATVLRRVFS